MSFQDDSHILQRLGILESTEESPRRAKQPAVKSQKQQDNDSSFVEVNIAGDIESESEEEDTIYAQDSLLPTGAKSKVIRSRAPSSSYNYLLLLISYFTLGLLFYNCTGELHHNTASLKYQIQISHCLGLILGLFIGRIAIYRLNIHFLYMLNFLIGMIISIFLVSVPATVNLMVAMLFQGMVVGALNYAGLVLFFFFWRTHNRTFLVFFTLLSLGSAITLLFDPSMTTSFEKNTTESIIKKREAFEISPFPPLDSNNTDNKPQKPEVAQGLNTVKTKTEENMVMREKLKSDVKNATNETTSGNFTFPTSTISVETTTIPTTAVPSTTIATTYPYERSNRGKDRYRLALPKMEEVLPNASAEIFLLIMLIFNLLLHCLGMICCCSQRFFAAEPKIVYDPTLPSFTVECKIRMSIFFFGCGFLEAFIIMYPNHQASLYQWSVFGARCLAFISGSIVYTDLSLFINTTVVVISSVFIMFQTASNFSLALLSATVGILPLFMFLNIESQLRPRPAILIDYFLLPSFAGKTIVSLLYWIQIPMWKLEYFALLAVALLIALVLLVKSVRKTVRLKQIMEYTSVTPQATLGEYLALLEQDHDPITEIDDEEDEEAEMI